MEYELLFFTTVQNEEKIGTIKKDVEEIVSSLGGKLAGDFNDIGKRKLAYPIKRNTHAFFSFVRFETEDKQSISEISKRLSLYDKIMRHMIVRADEIGKMVGAPVMEQAPREKFVKKPVEVVAAKPVEEKPVETKPKASMAELDEKLSEILEEAPE